MGAINLLYKQDLVYYQIIDNTIILKNKDDDSIVYTLPIPKNFNICNIDTFANKSCITIIPYKLNKPSYFPKQMKNVHINRVGLYCGTYESKGFGNVHMTYIDTSLLNEQSYYYATNGKFKITESDIPDPFWLPHHSDIYVGWKKPSDISEIVNSLSSDARLINEEELVSIYALNSLGLEFEEYITLEMITKSFNKQSPTKKYVLRFTSVELDNWYIAARSRENRDVLRLLRSEESVILYNEIIRYENTSFTRPDDKNTSFKILPVLDNKVKEKQNIIHL